MSQTSTIRINSTAPIGCTTGTNGKILLEQLNSLLQKLDIVSFHESHAEAVCAAIMAKAEQLRARSA